MPTEYGRYGHAWQRKRLAIASLLVPALTWRPETLALPIGVLLGKFINPDQDAWNKLGLLEGALGLDAFRQEIPHRGRASHTIGVASLLLFLPIVLGLIITAAALGILRYHIFWKAVFWLTMGVVVDNAAHIISDRAWSLWKRIT